MKYIECVCVNKKYIVSFKWYIYIYKDLNILNLNTYIYIYSKICTYIIYYIYKYKFTVHKFRTKNKRQRFGSSLNMHANQKPIVFLTRKQPWTQGMTDWDPQQLSHQAQQPTLAIPPPRTSVYSVDMRQHIQHPLHDTEVRLPLEP